MFSTARRTLEADGFRGMTVGLLLVILNESFAALDPETLQRCLRCVLKCAATVLVIAHP